MAEAQELAVKAATSTWDDVRLWGAVAISIFSLVWSERNRRVTEKATIHLRQQTVRLEEFRTGVKAPLVEALKDCDDKALEAEAVARSGQTMKQLSQGIQDLNRSVIQALAKVEARLTDANRSDFANGDNWLDDFDDLQDKILAGFNEASNTVNSDPNRMHALLKVANHLRQLRNVTIQRIDAETKAITTSHIQNKK